MSYDFRPKHSTEHAALQFNDYIMNQLDNGKTVFSIFALDSIDHSSCDLLTSYLNNRKHVFLSIMRQLHY